MVNVLLIGATGYIGQATAYAFTSSGLHQVYGLARTEDRAKLLSSLEVTPISGTATSASLIEAIQTHHIDTVVDLAGSEPDTRHLLAALSKLSAERITAAAAEGYKAPKLGFIYISGTWVHGSSEKPINDLLPVGVTASPNAPAALVAWRAKLERDILAESSTLDVMIIRPALVYGRANTIWTIFLKPILDAAAAGAKSVSVPADRACRPGLVHVDDVASGIRAAVEKLPLISGTGVYPVFDLVSSHETMSDVLGAAAKELGFNGEVVLAGPGENLFAQAMNTTFNGSGGRAESILGWVPRRRGLLPIMGVVAKSWAASL
ncbi:hypothetical protein F5884DRAFT_307829 [Xylogone sp. PMI_703]|nr:hypothetical protein F5884DRAFT_307829 [Xylogone sp. PMI_703]